MLLPFETVYALAGAALIGTAVTIVLFLVRVARWMRWIGPTLLAASAGLIGVLFWFGTQVVEVSNDGAGATIRKLVLVGSKTMTLGGKPVELSTQGRSETIIVNDSDRTLQLSTHSYASSPTELATETEPQENRAAQRVPPRSRDRLLRARERTAGPRRVEGELGNDVLADVVATAAARPRRPPYTLLLAIVAISTGAPFARWAEPAPPMTIAALRVTFAAALLLAAGWRELGSLRRIIPKDRPLVVLSGALLAVHFGSWIASLAFTSTAASVALVCTNPIFAALFGTLLGDRVRPREIGGIAVAAFGCAVLAGGDWSAGGDALLGDGLALIGAASAAAYLVVGRRLRTALPLLPYLGAVNAIAAVTLIIVALAMGEHLAALPSHAYVASLCAAVVASFIGHGLLNAAVRITPTHLVALAVLGEPIGSSLITWAVFGEQPPLHAAFGGAIVLAGIALGFVRRR